MNDNVSLARCPTRPAEKLQKDSPNLFLSVMCQFCATCYDQCYHGRVKSSKDSDVHEKIKRLSLKDSPIYGELIVVG